jgi:hypothetical protein
VSSRSVTRKARGRARRRSARSRHSGVGCRWAPLPGARPAGSGSTLGLGPLMHATMRSSSFLVARRRHPTQVRSGTARARWEATARSSFRSTAASLPAARL